MNVYEETVASVQAWLKELKRMTDQFLTDFSAAWGIGKETETFEGKKMRGVNDRVPDEYVTEWVKVFGSLNAPKHIPPPMDWAKNPIIKAEERFQASDHAAVKARRGWRYK